MKRRGHERLIPEDEWEQGLEVPEQYLQQALAEITTPRSNDAIGRRFTPLHHFSP